VGCGGGSVGGSWRDLGGGAGDGDLGVHGAARAEGLDSGEVLAAGRVRRPGAGEVAILEREPKLWEDLDRLVDPVTRGDPESPLRWTSKSGAKLAEALRAMGHEVVDRTVLRLLKADGYRLQANKKTREGASHPDRDAQFQHISQTAVAAIAAGQPVISVDTKKRELVGDFMDVGRELERGNAGRGPRSRLQGQAVGARDRRRRL